MPLFCKQCNSRRLPEHHEAEKQTMWLCKECKNFVDMGDVIIREQTDEEREEVRKKQEEFEKTTPLSNEKRVRRKGVN